MYHLIIHWRITQWMFKIVNNGIGQIKIDKYNYQILFFYYLISYINKSFFPIFRMVIDWPVSISLCIGYLSIHF